MLHGMYGGTPKMHYSTMAGLVISTDVISVSVLQTFGADIFMEELCTNFENYVPSCENRRVRLALVRVVTGGISLGIIAYAFVVWGAKLRRIAAINRDSRGESTEQKKVWLDDHALLSPTEALFEFLFTLHGVNVIIRELPYYHMLL